MKSPVSDYGGTRCVPGFAKGWKPRVQCGTWFERRAVIFKTPESIFPSADRSSKLAHASMQYDMHASSFQRDITTSQQGAKTNGAPEYCTRDWMLDNASGYYYNRPMIFNMNHILDSITMTQ
ncbi:unnamed protein product [Brassica rapa subsp. trilocularis]